MTKWAYIRVSTKEQNESRQLLAMKNLDIPIQNTFIDKESGKDFNRLQYKKLLKKLREGDVLYVLSIDRLGRNYEEIQNQWKYLINIKKIDICVIDMPLLDTRHAKDLMGTFISDLVLQILSFCSENERNNIKQRQREGIAAAKRNGVVFGRPSCKEPDDFKYIVSRWNNGIIHLEEALQASHMTKTTFYRHAKKCLANNFV